MGQGHLDSTYYIIYKSSKGHSGDNIETQFCSLCFIYPQQPSITFALRSSRMPSRMFLKADKKSHLWIWLKDTKKSANLIHSWSCGLFWACRIFLGLRYTSVIYKSPLLATKFLSLPVEMSRKQETGFSQTRLLNVLSV